MLSLRQSLAKVGKQPPIRRVPADVPGSFKSLTENLLAWNGLPHIGNHYDVVIPNLGQPLLLIPSDLQTFDITVAGTTDVVPSAHELECVLRANRLGAGRRIGASADHLWSSAWLKIIQVHDQAYVHQKPPGFPVSSADHQYVAGYRWHFRVTVGLDYPESVREDGWPAVLDILDGKGGVKYHALYVDERLSHPDNFVIFHITDPHVSGRNDRIPQVLAEVRTPEEYDDLLKRYSNFNDNLRKAIAYANAMARNELVVVVATGDVVDYYQDKIPDSMDPNTSHVPLDARNNVCVAHDLFTGLDGLGEPLACPLFTLLGNHDYLIPEVPLRLAITAPELAFITLRTRETFGTFGLSGNEGKEYDYWASGCPPVLDPGSHPSHPQFIQGMEGRYCVKDHGNYEVRYDALKAYSLIASAWGHLRSYLSQFSYETDFRFKIGTHHFVCLNTGEDIHPTPKEFLDKYVQGFILGQAKEDYINDGPHCRGIIREHVDLIQAALTESGDQSIIFCFIHAPLINLNHDHENNSEVLFEDNVASELPPPPGHNNAVTAFLYWMTKHDNSADLPADPPDSFVPHDWCDELTSWGFTLGGTSYIKDLDESAYQYEDPRGWLSWACADGGALRNFLDAITARQLELGIGIRRPVVVLSGHTSDRCEFRISKGGYLINPSVPLPRLYCHYDDYSGSHPEFAPGSQALINASDEAVWLSEHTPLQLITGGLKGRDCTFRILRVSGNAMESMQEITLERD
jgi:hypothetical protein